MYGRRYLDKAMDHFRSRFPRPVFVIVSDDMNWCSREMADLEDVELVGTALQEEDENDVESAAVDFGVLVECDHVIVTYGTFGIWAAHLAGGEAVLAEGFTERDTEEVIAVKRAKPKNWVFMGED